MEVRGGKRGWRINGRTVKFWCSDNGQKTDEFRAMVGIAMSRALSNNICEPNLNLGRYGNFVIYKERRRGGEQGRSPTCTNEIQSSDICCVSRQGDVVAVNKIVLIWRAVSELAETDVIVPRDAV